MRSDDSIGLKKDPIYGRVTTTLPDMHSINAKRIVRSSYCASAYENINIFAGVF